MFSSIIGGVIIAVASLLVALLRRSGQRQPKPFWMRKESIESWVGIGLVAMIALGFAMIVKSVSDGGIAALIVGAAVAIAGSGLAVVFVRRKSPRAAGFDLARASGQAG